MLSKKQLKKFKENKNSVKEHCKLLKQNISDNEPMQVIKCSKDFNMMEFAMNPSDNDLIRVTTYTKDFKWPSQDKIREIDNYVNNEVMAEYKKELKKEKNAKKVD